MLHKFSSNYINHHHQNSKGEGVRTDDSTNISDRSSNIENKQLNPISILSHASQINYSDTMDTIQRDNINLRSITKHTIATGTIKVPDSNKVNSSDLSISSSSSNLTSVFENQKSIVESLRYKLATNQPINDTEATQVAELLTNLREKTSELLNLFTTVVTQTDNNNNDEEDNRSENMTIRMGQEQPYMITSLNNQNSTTIGTNIAVSSVPNHNNTSYNNMGVNLPLSSIQPGDNTNNLSNFFIRFDTIVSTEEQHFDRVITELAPIEIEPENHNANEIVDDVLSVTHTSSVTSSTINHPINEDNSQSSEGIRSRSTSISVDSEIHNFLNSTSVPTVTQFDSTTHSLSTTYIPNDIHHSHSRRSRVVRSLMPNNPTKNL